MAADIEAYESVLAAVVTDVCEDPWFSEQLARFRAGDEEAGRRISGSCLRLVVDIVRAHCRPEGRLTLLDLVQEGNLALWRTINRFTGSTASEFKQEVVARVTRLVVAMSSH